MTAANQSLPAGHAYLEKQIMCFICRYSVVYGRSHEVYAAVSSAPVCGHVWRPSAKLVWASLDGESKKNADATFPALTASLTCHCGVDAQAG